MTSGTTANPASISATDTDPTHALELFHNCARFEPNWASAVMDDSGLTLKSADGTMEIRFQTLTPMRTKRHMAFSIIVATILSEAGFGNERALFRRVFNAEPATEPPLTLTR